jgi:hypothetical protein
MPPRSPASLQSQARSALDFTGGNRQEPFEKVEGNFPQAAARQMVALTHLHLTFIRLLRLGMV